MSKLCQFGGRPWSYLFKKISNLALLDAPLTRLTITVIKSRPTSTRCCLITANNFSIPIRKMSQKTLDINAEKDRYLQMPLIDKRKTYRCGSKYVELSNIPTWEEYAQKLNLRSSSNQRFKVKSALNKKVSPLVSDITTLEVDAIVNAANKTLLGGGGVDGAIHRGAGRSLKEECASLNGCQTGEAKITGGYLLPAKYVIHTVGPVGENESKLKSCYESCLEYIKKNNLKTIAFPCISTGIYGYPNEAAAHVALNTVRNWLEKDNNADNVDRIIFCLFLPVDIQIYEQLMLEYFPL